MSTPDIPKKKIYLQNEINPTCNYQNCISLTAYLIIKQYRIYIHQFIIGRGKQKFQSHNYSSPKKRIEFKHHKANGDPHTWHDYSSPNAQKPR
jgi:hypothetical protein